MHSLEEQTKESIKILLSKKTPFIVALNKIDRLYEWKSSPDLNIEETMKRQSSMTMNDFQDHFRKVSGLWMLFNEMFFLTSLMLIETIFFIYFIGFIFCWF